MRQEQFLDVVEEIVARDRWTRATSHLEPTSVTVALDAALGQVLAEDVRARVDVPAFDRSNMDGFAVRAADTFGADELGPVHLEVSEVRLGAGRPAPARFAVTPGSAALIATGGVVPPGADAVVMVEHTLPASDGILVDHSVVPGENITFAGSDIGRGDFVVRSGTRLSARETGVLAAVGVDEVRVHRPVRVVVVSTGDEIVEPGSPLGLGQVYDSNQRILIDTITELGADARPGGVIPDREDLLRPGLEHLLADPDTDMIILSGGTSKGAGDLNARVVTDLGEADTEWPGVVVHGVALKPGKPLMLAVIAGKPVVVLPGFPTSAIFTFHEFVAPLIQRLGGRSGETGRVVRARVPMRIEGARGRTSYVLVDLVRSDRGLAAFPLGAGSGSVTAFSRADGFIRIGADTEYVETGTELDVRLLDPGVRPADLVVIGSHCVGLDHLVGLVGGLGYAVKMIPVGSQAGLAALTRGEGDVAGVHLLDEESGIYNTPFLPDGVRLVKGYRRRQGVVFRPGDSLAGLDEEAFQAALRERRMVNRNRGAGTRVLIDRLLEGARPDGYLNQARTHHGVAAAVEQGRADWGMTLDTVAAAAGLEFWFVADEEFDLAVREDRLDTPAVQALLELLADPAVRGQLGELGFFQ